MTRDEFINWMDYHLGAYVPDIRAEWHSIVADATLGEAVREWTVRFQHTMPVMASWAQDDRPVQHALGELVTTIGVALRKEQDDPNRTD